MKETNKLGILSKISEIYNSGGNIIQYLRSLENKTSNSLEDILISYDFQAGSYIELVEDNRAFIEEFTDLIIKEFNSFSVSYSSILEVGVGEATTLTNLVNKCPEINNAFGFDISWSRIRYAKKYVEDKKGQEINLFTGDLFSIPLGDSSIDIVYTSHSLEPNGGRETEALKELYRVTAKYLVLIEPAYEFVDRERQERMESHGYVKNLVKHSQELGYEVVENRLFEISSRSRNPSQIIVIRKEDSKVGVNNEMVCPNTKTPLIKEDNFYYSNKGLLAYPIIDGVPCLLPQNAIVATHLRDFR